MRFKWDKKLACKTYIYNLDKSSFKQHSTEFKLKKKGVKVSCPHPKKKKFKVLEWDKINNFFQNLYQRTTNFSLGNYNYVFGTN